MTSAVLCFDRNIWTRILKFMEPEVLFLTLNSALVLDTFEKRATALGSNFALWATHERFISRIRFSSENATGYTLPLLVEHLDNIGNSNIISKSAVAFIDSYFYIHREQPSLVEVVFAIQKWNTFVVPIVAAHEGNSRN